MALCETWLKTPTDAFVRNDLTPTRYAIKHTPRPTGKGGRVAIIHKSGLNIRKWTIEVFRTFEHIKCTLKTCKSSMRIVVIYRPPPTVKCVLTTSAFFGEWGRFIDQHVLQPGPLIVIGDPNFHLDDKADSDARRLTSSLDSTGMAMHVHGSTRRKGHTLDVLLIRCMDEYLVRNVASTDIGISDHSAMKFTISAARCRAALTKVKYRKLRALNADILRQDIPVLRLEDLESLSVDELVNNYDATLVNLVETHAPLLEKNVRVAVPSTTIVRSV